MTTARRTIRSSPERDVVETWKLIVELLSQGKDGPARQELMSVGGVASSIIAERSPQESAIVATCEGPRTRIYCLYDDDAIDGSDAQEEPFGYDPLKGEWSVSLPCPKQDLDWVRRALKEKTNRITARDQSLALGEEPVSEKALAEFIVDEGEFLK